MASQTIETHRAGAEVYHGNAVCRQKSIELLVELDLPKGLFPLEDIEEFGYNRTSGFIWLIQKKKKEHTYKQVKKLCSYAPEVTAFVEPRKLKKLTGVKVRELLIWLSVVEVYIDNPSSVYLTFKSGTGLSDTFPTTAFELDPLAQGEVREMTSQSIEAHRAGAEVHHGDAVCRQKSIELLVELDLPKGLLPLVDIEEFGYNRTSGFIWLIQKKKKEHTYKQVKKLCSYAPEVTAFVGPRILKKVTGVKVRELLIWLSIAEVYIDNPSSGKLTIRTGTGLSDTFPATAFELE